ncbi:hypothetical protein [Lachnoanaerobaculum gingivalis]|uniref:hypothetical protein n=1 Tax=Lachnoanaerobaculum gingivalis TaxID=2490855 RepID=UPI0028D71EA6|nr:hypothetical protein [Lachnoanaerobaculum gingivalis]
MADAILMSVGAGGVTSDDVTASKAQVLQGYRTITSDSDDEVVEGTIPNRGNGMDAVDFTNAHWESKFVARMEEGYYSQVGQWKPYVAIPYAVLANVAGIDAGKMLDTLTIAGVRGTIPIYGAWNSASEVINATWENPKKIFFRFKKGYYLDDGQYPPSVSATYKDIANAVGIRASKILDDENILGTQGTIPRWICTTGGVITALNNEGFVWDDTSNAGRGRGIVARIPDKHFIQDASYVFLSSPNFYPQNLVKNVNINGVTGTRDYIDLISPTWLSDATLNLQVNTVEKEIHIPNKFLQYNGLFMKVIVWGSTLDGYYKDSNGGACPCILAVTNWDGGATFTIKVGAAMFYGTLERQGSGFDDFKLRYRGSTAFNLSLNFLITQGFSHQWAGNYAT